MGSWNSQAYISLLNNTCRRFLPPAFLDAKSDICLPLPSACKSLMKSNHNYSMLDSRNSSCSQSIILHICKMENCRFAD